MNNTLNRRMFMQQGGVVPSQTMLPPAQTMAPQMMAPPAQTMLPPAQMEAPPAQVMDPQMMAPPPQMMDPSMLPPGATQQVSGDLMEQEGAAITEGIMSQVDSAQDYEELMNAIRGNELPIASRRGELAELVGTPDAEQTPDSVLTLVQPTLSIVDAQGGLDSLMQEQADVVMEDGTGAPTQMAGGLGSMLMAGQPEEPVQMADGGLVRKMANGSTGSAYLDGPVPTIPPAAPTPAPRSAVEQYLNQYEAVGPLFEELMGDPAEREKRKKGSRGNLQLKFAADVLSGLYAPTAAPVSFLGRLAPAAGAFAENLGTYSAKEQERADKMKAARLQLTTAEVANARAVAAAEAANKRAITAADVANARAVAAALTRTEAERDEAELLATAKAREPVTVTGGTDLVTQEGELLFSNLETPTATDIAAQQPENRPFSVLAEWGALLDADPTAAIDQLNDPLSPIHTALATTDVAQNIPPQYREKIRALRPELRARIDDATQLKFRSVSGSQIDAAVKQGESQGYGGDPKRSAEYTDALDKAAKAYDAASKKIEAMEEGPEKDAEEAKLRQNTTAVMDELRGEFLTGDNKLTDYAAASGFWSIFFGTGRTVAENIFGGMFQRTGWFPNFDYKENAEAHQAFKIMVRDLQVFYKEAAQAGSGDRILKAELDNISDMLNVGNLSRVVKSDVKVGIELARIRDNIILIGEEADRKLLGNIYQSNEQLNQLQNTVLSARKNAANLDIVSNSLKQGVKRASGGLNRLPPSVPVAWGAR